MQYKILIADDNTANIDLIRFILDQGKDKLEFYSATDGATAIKIAQKQLPDLILLDWHMPKMTGIQVIQSLKAKSETQNIPMLLITGDPNEENIAKAFEAGARDYITKPFNELELISRVRAALKESFYRKTLVFPLVEINNLQEEFSLLLDKNNKTIIEKFDYLAQKIKNITNLIKKI